MIRQKQKENVSGNHYLTTIQEVRTYSMFIFLALTATLVWTKSSRTYMGIYLSVMYSYIAQKIALPI